MHACTPELIYFAENKSKNRPVCKKCRDTGLVWVWHTPSHGLLVQANELLSHPSLSILNAT